MALKMKAARDKILIVDDERYIRLTLSEALRSWNYDSVQAENLAAARRLLSEEDLSAALLDIDLPDGSGLDLLPEIREQHPYAIVVMITGNVNVSNTVAALRGGAHDFIGKPVKLEELRVTIRNGLETRQLRREVRHARRERSQNFGFDQIIGESDSMRKAKELARRVAESDVLAILLQGESGTGKDLFARAIHSASDRADAPYVAINCAALPAQLIESELFGYEKGAFTDAKSRKEGLFEQAQGGTLFLDEIGEMELALQAKLLRVLEDGMFRRVGGLRDLPLDVCVITASNRDLKREAEAGNFRLDLYYRLSVIQIDIPPLRTRGNDVLLLAEYYLERANQKRRAGRLRGLSPAVARIFQNYKWTGNVRELKNIIERASILEDGAMVTTDHLPADLITGQPLTGLPTEKHPAIILPSGGMALEEIEFELARQAMERTGGNLTHAARLLHISRDQLRYKLKKSESNDLALTQRAGESRNE